MMKKNRSKMLDRIFAYGASFWRKAISIICSVHGFYFTFCLVLLNHKCIIICIFIVNNANIRKNYEL